MKSYIRYLIYLLASVVAFEVGAQTLKLDDGMAHWEGGVNAGLNNDGYEWEVRVVYIFPFSISERK